ncbi:MAG: tRNA 2-thiouridine(34) synthase MnmA [Candidatus Omnitrophota bacterium]
MRVVAAMSGGVDSSVAAFLMKREGREVIGVTIKTWPKEECGGGDDKMCCSLDSIQYARSAAEDMGIPYYVVDLSKEFAEKIKKYFVEEYARGRTPSPCVYCNSKIKFGCLLKKAREMGAQRIATGHYARIIKRGGKCFLAEAVNGQGDQSYFLYDIPKEELMYLDFPLGELTKKEVVEIARGENFMSAEKKPSQDICFASGAGGYKKYLEKTAPDIFVPGDIVNAAGKKIAEHKGIAGYTVGQRHGLGIGSHEALYVTKIDAKNNAVTVSGRENAMKSRLRVKGFNWLIMDELNRPRSFGTRIRYNSKKAEARVVPKGRDEAIIEFSEPQFAPAPGQAAVFYEDEIVAGGAWIEEALE